MSERINKLKADLLASCLPSHMTKPTTIKEAPAQAFFGFDPALQNGKHNDVNEAHVVIMDDPYYEKDVDRVCTFNPIHFEDQYALPKGGIPIGSTCTVKGKNYERVKDSSDPVGYWGLSEKSATCLFLRQDEVKPTHDLPESTLCNLIRVHD